MTKTAFESEPYSTTPVEAFLEALASPSPTPGGGSAAALAGAMGCSLGEMAATIGLGKESLKASWPVLEAARIALNKARFALVRLVEEDSLAYERVTAAYKLPKSSPAEEATRRAAIHKALEGAAEPPLAVIGSCREGLEHLATCLTAGPRSTRTDVQTGVALLRAALDGARLNAETNIVSLPEGAAQSRLRESLNALLGETTTALHRFES
ncbi:MAG: cyclodeaminase/cyclohydrolase family protein [Euryarchaeota archaeon]|nr:cyclodeaminase/cyclohydrolase family protein [Euryarchaeota archaeon]